jgi:hypothetical protein
MGMRRVAAAIRWTRSIVRSVVVGAVVLVVALPCGAGAQAQTSSATLGPFGDLFPVAGSLNEAGPFIDNSGPATSGELVDAFGSPAFLADGSFLVAQGGEPAIVDRVSVDGWSTVVAGYQPADCVGAGCGGPPGDGGPAVKATLRDATAVAAMPDGGFVVADKLAGVVRRVDANGIISTIAGRPRDSEGAQPVGIGGPATKARLVEPSSLAVAPDGELFILDGYRWILRVDQAGVLRLVADLHNTSPSEIALATDGSLLVLDSRGIAKLAAGQPVTRLARFPAFTVGLVPLADGGALTAAESGGSVLRISPGGSMRVVLGPRAWRDFAGRDPSREEYSVFGLALNSQGLFVDTGSAVLLAPLIPTTRLLVRIRDARTTAGRVRLRIQSTRAAEATLTVHRFSCCRADRRLTTTVVAAKPGASWLEIPDQQRRAGLFRLQVRLSDGHAVAIDSVVLLLGRSLPRGLIRSEMRQETEDRYRFRCRRISTRRIDCWSADYPHSCQALQAGPDGVVRSRRYRCRRTPLHFRLRPHWTGNPTVIRWDGLG